MRGWGRIGARSLSACCPVDMTAYLLETPIVTARAAGPDRRPARNSTGRDDRDRSVSSPPCSVVLSGTVPVRALAALHPVQVRGHLEVLARRNHKVEHEVGREAEARQVAGDVRCRVVSEGDVRGRTVREIEAL